MNVLRSVNENGYDIRVVNAALPDAYMTHGNVAKLKEMCGFTPDDIIKKLDRY